MSPPGHKGPLAPALTPAAPRSALADVGESDASAGSPHARRPEAVFAALFHIVTSTDADVSVIGTHTNPRSPTKVCAYAVDFA